MRCSQNFIADFLRYIIFNQQISWLSSDKKKITRNQQILFSSAHDVGFPFFLIITLLVETSVLKLM